MEMGTTMVRDMFGLWKTSFRNTQDYEYIGGNECNAESHCEEYAAVKNEGGKSSGHLSDYSTAHNAHGSEVPNIQAGSCALTTKDTNTCITFF